MKKIRTWQLCRTGTFGQDGAKITEQDLKDIESTFETSRPITIGHEAAHADNIPKFGDVLAIDGIYPSTKYPGEKVLVGDVILHPALEKQFDDKGDGSGTFEGWSVTIPRRASDGKRYLHSLAICGAVPPKIPGLEQLMTKNVFSDGDSVEVFNFNDIIEYQEVPPMTEEEKKKMADLEAENKKLKEEAAAVKGKNPEGGNPQAEKPAAGDPKKSAEYEDLQKRCESLEAANRTALVNGLTGRLGGKVPAAVMPKVQAVANALACSGTCEFSDSGKTETKSLLDAFGDVLDGLLAVNPVVTKQVFHPSESFSDHAADDKTDYTSVAAKM